MSVNSLKKFNFYSRFETGHRVDYIRFCESYLGGARITGLELLRSPAPLVFLMIEECFFLYVCIGLLRSLMGRKTVGLVFRAKECALRSTMRLKVKHLVLRLLKYSSNVKSVSIIPFYALPEAEYFCDDWIFDFQFWDREFLASCQNQVEVSETVQQIKNKAAGRKILCAVGKQDTEKGFDGFAKLYLSSERLRAEYLFVSGGKISGIDEHLVQGFEQSGGLLMNKRISDSELVALYEVADVVWVCYAPSYDQSSGVLGRALQYHKPVLVRKGSIAYRLSRDVVPRILFDTSVVDQLLERNEGNNNTHVSRLVRGKKYFLEAVING